MRDQSLKADAGKPRWGLLPWRAIALLADVVTFGASKYGDASWRRVEASRYEDALHRHLHAWRMFERNDRESGIHHLAHALCNIAFMLELSLDKDDADAEQENANDARSISDLRHDLDALRMEHAARANCSMDWASTGHRVAE